MTQFFFKLMRLKHELSASSTNMLIFYIDIKAVIARIKNVKASLKCDTAAEAQVSSAGDRLQRSPSHT